MQNVLYIVLFTLVSTTIFPIAIGSSNSNVQRVHLTEVNKHKAQKFKSQESIEDKVAIFFTQCWIQLKQTYHDVTKSPDPIVCFIQKHPKTSYFILGYTTHIIVNHLTHRCKSNQ